MESTRSDSAQSRTISTAEAREMLASNEASALDLRDDEAWRSGHIPGARRAHEDLEAGLGEIEAGQTVIVVCEDGTKSAEVAARLCEDGREAVSVEGGMGSWRSDDMPMQPSEDVETGTAI